MSLIDVDELIENVRNLQDKTYNNLVTLILNAPTVDAVEVVRCKDCIREQDCEFAQYQGENGYCSYGERICDECLVCFNYWRNDDNYSGCQGLAKPCNEFRVVDGD